MYPKHIGERIRSARLNLSMSQEKLANVLHLKHPAISQIENGKRAVDSMELVRLSKVLQKPLSFFVESTYEESAQEEPIQILYRADEISPQDRAVVEDFQTLCSDYASLENLLSLDIKTCFPRWNSEIKNKWEAIQDGQRIALSLRESLHLGAGPLRNIGQLMENLGIKVIYRQLPNSKAWGFSITSKTLGHCLFVNTASPITRQRFTIAHELGHLIMDHNHVTTIYSEEHSPDQMENNGKDRLIETRANVFAAAFLAPDISVKEFLLKYGIDEDSKDRLTNYIIGSLSEYFGLSYDSMLWRLVNLRYMTKDERKLYLLQKPFLGEETPDSAIENIPERYRTLALEAYRRVKISIGRLSDYLRVDIYNARKLVKELKIQQVPG